MSATALLERTAPLYDRVKSLIPPIEWPVFANDIDAILALKRERDAVISGCREQALRIAGAGLLSHR